jgi:hypothetical protein
MLSKYGIVLHSDDVVHIVLVVIVKVFQYAQFDASLVLELLFVSDYLDSDHFLSLVIQAFDCLTKTALA